MTDIRIIVPTAVRQASGIDWPAQDAVSYLPAVRNRNKGGVAAEGRGFGMDTRHAYDAWNVSAQTGTTPDEHHVTNRDATGAGSLHQMWEVETGPRIIVFDVAGEWDLNQKTQDDTGTVWLCGQSAPGLVWINTVGNSFWVANGGDTFIQHIAFWNNDTPSSDTDTLHVARVDSNPALTNFVLDHCFMGGGSDEIFDIHRAKNVTLIDSLIALPKGTTSISAGRGTLTADNAEHPESTDKVSLIGVVHAFCNSRTPLWRVTDGSLCNVLTYGCNQEVQISGRGSDFEVTLRLNIEGYRSIDGSGTAEIHIFKASLVDVPATDSEFYFNDNFGRNFVSDEWDIVVDPDNQEADIRVESRVTAAWPTGLVAAPNRSSSEADYITLMTQNIGPRPNERISWLQDIIDDIINGTGSIQDDYTGATVSEASNTFVSVANPHEESSTDPDRTNLEVQLLDLSEGFLV